MLRERLGKQEIGAFAGVESCGRSNIADKSVDIADRAA